MNRLPALLIAAVAGAPLALRADPAPLHCALYAISGTTAQETPVSPFVGELTLTNLITNGQRQVLSSTVMLGILGVDADGVQKAVTTHDMTSTDGAAISFTTFDDATLTPTGVAGVFALASRAKLIDGRGKYNCGEVVFSDPSTVDFSKGAGVATLHGLAKLCRCPR